MPASLASTKKAIQFYNEQSPNETMFLTGLFGTPERNFYNSESIELDIVRNDLNVSIAVQDLTVGSRKNSSDIYSTKEFKPPIHSESGSIDVFSLMKRSPGQNPFEDTSFKLKLMDLAYNQMYNMERKIARSIEIQAAQIFQTGKVDLKNETGQTLYNIDFKPKVDHFPTAGTSWGTATGQQMLSDIGTLANKIRTNGKARPDQLIFGSKALTTFLGNEEVQKYYDNRRIDLGTIAPAELKGNGGTYHGTVSIGSYKYDIWSYDGFYKDPHTGIIVPYVEEGSVILRASSGRLDGTYGNIPNLNQILNVSNPAQRLLSAIPNRLSSSEKGRDLFFNAWCPPNGLELVVNVSSRPLMIPTAIDTFGCLKTGL